MNWKYTLCEPDVNQSDLDSVIKVFKKNWFTMGEITIKFEQKFAEMLNVKHAFAVSNGTSALHLANIVCGVTTSDEVICPALTFVATANASLYEGAKVIFADSKSENDLSIDPEDIEKKITPQTKAITIVHYGGFACDMDKILKIVKRYNLKLIEDCAHAPLAEYRFTDGDVLKVGTMGDVGCFSFYGNKNLTTGEGGMITTNCDDIAEKIRLLRSHGMTSLTFDRHNKHASGYDIVSLGYNYRIDEIRAAMGYSQLNRLKENSKKRQQIFKYYLSELSDNQNIVIPFNSRDISLSTPHIMSVIVLNGYTQIKKALFDNRVQTSKHYDLIPGFSLYKETEFVSKIEKIDNLLTLPLYPGMKYDDVKYICNIINKESDKIKR